MEIAFEDRTTVAQSRFIERNRSASPIPFEVGIIFFWGIQYERKGIPQGNNLPAKKVVKIQKRWCQENGKKWRLGILNHEKGNASFLLVGLLSESSPQKKAANAQAGRQQLLEDLTNIGRVFFSLQATQESHCVGLIQQGGQGRQ